MVTDDKKTGEQSRNHRPVAGLRDVITDKRMYSRMVAAIPITPEKTMNTTAERRSVYCSLFSFHAGDDIFNENIGISDTSRNEVATADTEKPTKSISGGAAARNPPAQSPPQEATAGENAAMTDDHKRA